MRTIFRKIRKSHIDSSTGRNYILYAIGEIALVVIGILIALQINNWNEESKARKFENKLLVELRNTLLDDFSLMNLVIKGNERSLNSCKIILSHLAENHSYHDSLAYHFESTNIWWKPILRTHAYENAKSYGLDFIESDSTRKLLLRLYEEYISFAETINERQTLYYYTTVTPVLTNLFLSIGKSLNEPEYGNTPVNFEELKRNDSYKNILLTSIVDRQNSIEYARVMLSSMEELESKLQSAIEY